MVAKMGLGAVRTFVGMATGKSHSTACPRCHLEDELARTE